jgi:hypothetical protein
MKAIQLFYGPTRFNTCFFFRETGETPNTNFNKMAIYFYSLRSIISFNVVRIFIFQMYYFTTHLTVYCKQLSDLIILQYVSMPVKSFQSFRKFYFIHQYIVVNPLWHNKILRLFHLGRKDPSRQIISILLNFFSEIVRFLRIGLQTVEFSTEISLHNRIHHANKPSLKSDTSGNPAAVYGLVII